MFPKVAITICNHMSLKKIYLFIFICIIMCLIYQKCRLCRLSILDLHFFLIYLNPSLLSPPHLPSPTHTNEEEERGRNSQVLQYAKLFELKKYMLVFDFLNVLQEEVLMSGTENLVTFVYVCSIVNK